MDKNKKIKNLQNEMSEIGNVLKILDPNRGKDVNEEIINEMVYTLCEGRHETPCNNYIFKESDALDPMDFIKMERIAYNVILSDINPKTSNSITIYVTGLTPALIAVLNVINTFCFRYDFSFHEVQLLHFNRDTGDYKPQYVF